MSRFGPCLALLLALGTASGHAAERGIYTIVEGEARVLRGATWFRLAPGARAEDGDVIDAGERAQVQLELARGGTLSVQGPALAHAVALPVPGEKANTVEIALRQGWFKAVVPGPPPLRLRLLTVAVEIADAIVVLHDNAASTELFVEKGRARIAVPLSRGKEDAVREGEFWRRTGERTFVTEERPPAAFVAAMPRDLRESLPSLAGRFANASPSLVRERDITFAEAQPWLSGPTRRVFARRFAGRLSDPAFRAAAAAQPIPEWDRILHPEKYLPEPAEQTQGGGEAGR